MEKINQLQSIFENKKKEAETKYNQKIQQLQADAQVVEANFMQMTEKASKLEAKVDQANNQLMKAQADINDLQNQVTQRDQLNAKLKKELDDAKQESMRSMMQVGELKAEMKASEILRKSTSVVEKSMVCDKELSLS